MSNDFPELQALRQGWLAQPADAQDMLAAWRRGRRRLHRDTTVNLAALLLPVAIALWQWPRWDMAERGVFGACCTIALAHAAWWFARIHRSGRVHAHADAMLDQAIAESRAALAYMRTSAWSAVAMLLAVLPFALGFPEEVANARVQRVAVLLLVYGGPLLLPFVGWWWWRARGLRRRIAGLRQLLAATSLE